MDIKRNNEVNIIIESNSENRVITEIENKVDTRVFYRFDLFIFVNNYAKNLSFCNLADVLANFFNDLLSILIDFCSFFAFFVSFSHLITSNSINNSKFLNFTFFCSLTTCNSSNIFIFYY